ncbi:DUF4097 family beta strand repeat-containing protein [Paenibacillus sp. 1P07SE]|uniref:DUF4097 family beta strand repeat-containing protein n=1 Tax=Paenibacillus sp. 1P07SE TaxID=3132209 RepID=UPI0039A74F6C
MTHTDNDSQPVPKRRLLSGLFGAMLPGGGQLYLGDVTKGLLLLAAAILDATAAVYYANAAGGRHLLLIVYLVLLLPVLYGYSVYDALQLAEAESNIKPYRKTLAMRYGQVVVLILIAACIILLIRAPSGASGPLQAAGDAAPSVMTAMISGFLIWRLSRGSWPFGRGTGALVLLLTAFTLAADRVLKLPNAETIYSYWLTWWPLVFVLLGLEWTALRLRNARRYRLDAPALLTAAVAFTAALGVAHYADLPVRWLDQWAAEHREFAGYTGETGYSYELEPILLEAEAWAELRVDNDNGTITLKSDDSSQLRIEAVVWIDLPDEEAARAVAERSAIRVSGDEALVIQTEGAGYGPEEGWKPRINVTVTIPLPADQENPGPLAVFLRGTAGDISVRDIAAPKGLHIERVYGEVKTVGTTGPLYISTRNGSIEAWDVSGSAELRGANGHIEAGNVTDDLTIVTVNGDLRISELGGALDAQTKHGEIEVEEAAGAVVADTLNGEIRIRSSRVGGSWHLDSAIGNITAALPREGDYIVSATVTFGEIHSELPLFQSGNHAAGSVGDGEHPVRLRGNSSISLHYYE